MDFEEQFGRSLREAGDSYTVDAQPLLERSLRRGRALRSRRIAYAVVASAASVALIVAGTALSANVGQPPSGTEQSSVPGARIVSLLEEMLPSGSVSGAWGIGAGGGRPKSEPPRAQLVYNDGHGAAQLELTFTRTNDSGVLGPSTCTNDGASEPGCEETKLPNGSTVSVEKQSFGGSVLLWTATLVTKSGDRIWLDETNSATGDPSSKVTRATPPLSAAQLSAIVTNSAWLPVFAAVRAAQPDGQPSQAQLNAIAKRLQPAGFSFGTSNAKNSEGFTAFPVNKNGAGIASRGNTQMTVRVEHWPGQARDEIRAEYFAEATALSGGTLVDTHPKTRSASSMLVTALRPDGTYVSILEDAADPSRPHLLLSLDQLKSIALSPLWSQ